MKRRASKAPIYELNFLPAARWFLLATFSTYFATLKMEAVRSFKTSVHFYETTRRHIPEDCTLHLCENLQSQILLLSSHLLLDPWSDQFRNNFLVKIKFTLLASSIILMYIYPKVKSIWNWSQNLHLQSREMHEISASTLVERLNGLHDRQEKRGTPVVLQAAPVRFKTRAWTIL
jgi:hypothetical protein